MNNISINGEFLSLEEPVYRNKDETLRIDSSSNLGPDHYFKIYKGKQTTNL